ncbi:ABC transporter substrate-binding protein [soil metagenome]
MKVVVPFAFVLTMLAACHAKADNFRIGYYDTADAPFVIIGKNGPVGIFPDVMAAIVKLTGDTLDQRYFPVKRIFKSFEDGLLDIEVGVNPKWRANSRVPGVYSKAFGTAKAVLCYRPGEVKTHQEVSDFYGQKIGLIVGYSYPQFDEAFANGHIQRADIHSNTSLLLMLKAKRFDQIILGTYVRQYWAKVDPESFACAEGRMIDESDMMLRLNPGKAAALPRLNAAIDALKKNGELNAIFKRYMH